MQAARPDREVPYQPACCGGCGAGLAATTASRSGHLGLPLFRCWATRRAGRALIDVQPLTPTARWRLTLRLESMSAPSRSRPDNQATRAAIRS